MIRLHTRALAAITLTLLALSGCSSDDDPPPPFPPNTRAEIQTYVEYERDLVLDRLVDVGFQSAVIPRITVMNTPQLMYYDGSVPEVVVPIWDELEADVQMFFNDAFGTVLPDMTGQEFFAETMHWFLIPHELGHHVEFSSGNPFGGDFYASELHANRMSIAYWIDAGEGDRVARYIEAVTAINETVDSPVPAGEDARTLFNDNYDNIPVPVYAWFQFEFAKQAYAERAANDLATVVETLTTSSAQ